jgi:lauroyl/myristoyl acyltransferase
MFAFLPYRIASLVLGKLPVPWLHPLGILVGGLAYLFARKPRAVVMRNLRVVCPEASEGRLRRLAFWVFVHGAWGNMETLALPAHADPSAMLESFTVDGWERFHRVRPTDRGLIMITSHVGSPATAGQIVAAQGVPCTVVVEQLNPPELHDLVAKARSAFGLRMLPIGPDAAKELLSALRRNEIVGILCDRDVAGTGELLPFFDRPALVTTAVATLARRANVPVLPCVAYRTGPFRGHAYVLEPFEIPRTSNARQDIREGTLRIVGVMEELIRKHPEQWAIFADVWPIATPETAGSEHSGTIGSRIGHASTLPGSEDT